jgi:hypothetical protein
MSLKLAPSPLMCSFAKAGAVSIATLALSPLAAVLVDTAAILQLGCLPAQQCVRELERACWQTLTDDQTEHFIVQTASLFVILLVMHAFGSLT